MTEPTETDKQLFALANKLENMNTQIAGIADANRMMLECLQRIASGKTKDARMDAHATILSLAMVSVS